MRAAVGGLNLFLMKGTELREGVYDVVCTVSTEGFSFGLREELGIFGSIRIGEDGGLRGVVAKGYGVFVGIDVAASRATETFTCFG